MKKVIGQKVTWRSQAQGCTKTKVGTIIEIVPPKKRPSTEKYPDLAGCGWGRAEESYIVSVPRIGKGGKELKPKTYWPLPSILQGVE